MKKLSLTALLLGAGLFIAMGTTTLSASDMKCGAGKCGSSVKTESKCGADKKASKCGADKKAATKCGGDKAASKCGGDKKAPKAAMKCGAGKCG